MDRTTAYVVGYAHPGLVNLFMSQARKQAREQERPSVKDQLKIAGVPSGKKAPIRKDAER